MRMLPIFPSEQLTPPTTPSSFISFTKKEMPTGVYWCALDSHWSCDFIFKEPSGERRDCRNHATLCDTVGNVCTGRLRLYCMHMTFLAPLLRWWAETEIGPPAFGGVTGDIEPFGSDFRDNQTLQDQVDLDWCVHVQVYGVFSLEHDHFVGQKGEAGVPVIYGPHSPFLFTQMIKILEYYTILNPWTYLSLNMRSLFSYYFSPPWHFLVYLFLIYFLGNKQWFYLNMQGNKREVTSILFRSNKVTPGL